MTTRPAASAGYRRGYRLSLRSGVGVSETSTTSYALALGARLRAIRVQQGMSLHAVGRKSEGRWKAIENGSYERGSRAVTVQRLADLAEFYGVPVAELLPGGSESAAPAAAAGRVVIDLERLAEVPTERGAPHSRYVA